MKKPIIMVETKAKEYNSMEFRFFPNFNFPKKPQEPIVVIAN